MLIFKADTKRFWVNELKSWLWLFALAAVLYFAGRFFSPPADWKLAVCVLVLLKLSAIVTNYPVTEIHIDKQHQQLIFVLSNTMSDRKIKQYGLQQVKSACIYHTGFLRYWYAPCVLKISLPNRQTFRITSRYGFSPDTLAAVEQALK